MIRLWNEGQYPGCTAPAAPVLQLGPTSSAILPNFQPDFIFPCPRITNTGYNWCRALNNKATLLHCQHVENWCCRGGSVRGPLFLVRVQSYKNCDFWLQAPLKLTFLYRSQQQWAGFASPLDQLHLFECLKKELPSALHTNVKLSCTIT